MDVYRADANDDFEPSRRTLKFEGAEREYFVALPRSFDPGETYWPLVFVHGGGGNARRNRKGMAIRKIADELGLPAVVILPRFITEDKQLSRFPLLGEGAFLREVLGDVCSEFSLHGKMLLGGYSMGGQFSHRFAFFNPDMVQACASLAAGTWSTPAGRLLIEGYGEVEDPGSFLTDRENAGRVPGRLRDLFDTRTAEVAALPAADGAEKVPFLVMCGTLDPRLSIARGFASRLRESGFEVETEWPRTPHSSDYERYRSGYDRYPRHAVHFFKKHTG